MQIDAVSKIHSLIENKVFLPCKICPKRRQAPCRRQVPPARQNHVKLALLYPYQADHCFGNGVGRGWGWKTATCTKLTLGHKRSRFQLPSSYLREAFRGRTKDQGITGNKKGIAQLEVIEISGAQLLVSRYSIRSPVGILPLQSLAKADELV